MASNMYSIIGFLVIFAIGLWWQDKIVEDEVNDAFTKYKGKNDEQAKD